MKESGLKWSYMRIKAAWLRHLRRRRGSKILQHSIYMAKLHKTPFKTLLENIFEATEKYQAGFTFPITASAALRKPELTRMIANSKHEIAVHGFKHVNYRYLSEKEQEDDIKRCISAFRKMGIRIFGFRAPYNAYTECTPRILEKFNFLWDGGIGYSPKYSELRSFFRIQIGDHESNFVCIPLSKWSDDKMIDECRLKNWQMIKILRGTLEKAADSHGIIMFDLHPIRIGQSKYIEVLEQLLEHGARLDGWFPTVTEAVEYWCKHEEWRGDASFCCLLTGDIDNFTFTDYLLRLT